MRVIQLEPISRAVSQYAPPGLRGDDPSARRVIGGIIAELTGCTQREYFGTTEEAVGSFRPPSEQHPVTAAALEVQRWVWHRMWSQEQRCHADIPFFFCFCDGTAPLPVEIWLHSGILYTPSGPSLN